jgi:hypothetical protein
MREVAVRPAHLPDALVRCLPVRFQEVQQHLLETPGRLVGIDPFPPGQVQRVHHLSVDVELELSRRGVADPDRRRALIARQPVELELGEAPFTGGPVHDLHLLRRPGDGAQEPVAPGARLLGVAGGQQRVQAEGRVTQPAVAVVPVPHSAKLLGQGRCRCRDDPTGRCVCERLQDEQRASDLITPLPLDFCLVRPLLPPGLGFGKRGFGVEALGRARL